MASCAPRRRSPSSLSILTMSRLMVSDAFPSNASTLPMRVPTRSSHWAMRMPWSASSTLTLAMRIRICWASVGLHGLLSPSGISPSPSKTWIASFILEHLVVAEPDRDEALDRALEGDHAEGGADVGDPGAGDVERQEGRGQLIVGGPEHAEGFRLHRLARELPEDAVRAFAVGGEQALEDVVALLGVPLGDDEGIGADHQPVVDEPRLDPAALVNLDCVIHR